MLRHLLHKIGVPVLVLWSLISGASATPKIELKSMKSEPAIIEADALNYDKEKQRVSAKGNVEVIQGERVLLADEMEYDQAQDKVWAKGHVTLVEVDGSVLFANEVQLSGGFATGVIKAFKARFSDNSVIASSEAKRLGDGTTQMSNVVYTPCKVCKEGRAPLWQLKARKATINEESERVSYRHASLEVKGVPVAYTPYFSHPTPDAKRKSGLLAPSYKNDSIFGTTVKTPFYYNIAPNMDAEISPSFTTDEGIILASEFRHLLPSGEYELEGSITNPRKISNSGTRLPGNDVRGHFEARGDFDIDDHWGWGFDAKRASDDTYLKRYNYGNEDLLTSRLFVERIENKNYVNVESVSFQGLQETDDPGKTPLVLPQFTYEWVGKPGWNKSYFSANVGALALVRDEGVSSRRVSSDVQWTLPYISKTGHLFELKTSLRGDAYSVEDVPRDSAALESQERDGFIGRAIPQAQLNWSLPLTNTLGKNQIFIEPVTQLIVSPHGGNPDKIPNEDSQDIEFSDKTLFDDHHFSGYDRVEGGPRTNYGVRGGVTNENYGVFDFLLGQHYKVKPSTDFEASTGLSEHFSDYVGRFAYDSTQGLELGYQFRFDKDSFTPRRNLVNAAIDISPIKMGVDYLSLDESFVSDNTLGSDREIMKVSSELDLTDTWAIHSYGHRDLEDGEWISGRMNLIYDSNCVDFSLSWFKEFTTDRDIRPNTTISFQVSLQNLGY